MIDPNEMTLDELRDALADVLPAHAIFDGWTDRAIAGAAAELGVPADRATLCFAGGQVDMIDAWFAAIDREMAASLPPEKLAGMKIRERITALVRARLDAASRHPDALRRALAILGRPRNAAKSARLGWRAADAMWRAAGDSSVDLAWYTKRLTLAAVYASTLMAWMDDDSADFSETHAFLDRRINDVMSFEKFKARIKPDPDRYFSPARFLGRLRYPTT